MRSVNTSYLPAIDHVRAFAAVLVILHHTLQHVGGRWAYGMTFRLYNPPPATPLDVLMTGGHTGVALFMVLSGFIFTRIAYGRAIRYRPFLVNRILRIYPLMLFLFLLAWLVKPASLGLRDLFGVIFIPFSIRYPVDLWFVPEVHPFTNLFWAISVEFKFYLLFPLILALVRRDGMAVLGVLMAGAIALRLLLVWDGAPAGSLAYWTIFGRIDQFLIGMGAAILVAESPRRNLSLFCLPALLIMGLLLYFYGNAGGIWSEPNWKILWPTVEGLVWAVFIIGYLDLATRLPVWLSRGLSLMGEASYSMYLLHMTVIAVVLKLGIPQLGFGIVVDSFLWSVLLVAPLTVAVSMVTFRVIERPFLLARLRYLDRPAEPIPSGADVSSDESPLTGRPAHALAACRRPSKGRGG
jgi:peptidoglycan/LPS O-acetylase OafA/YrhL